jgi:hypothetical protein
MRRHDPRIFDNQYPSQIQKFLLGYRQDQSDCRIIDVMPQKPPSAISLIGSSDDNYRDEEAARRRDEALRRALNTPPTPHKSVERTQKAKERPASKGRVHKGKTRR